jgi:hypothetical protein
MKSIKWLCAMLGSVGTILFLLGLLAFLIDPFMQYRVTEDKYLLNSRLVNAGLIKNYNYDTVVIGSSMMQNFNMGSFREKLNLNPIKITTGGISLLEIQKMTDLVLKENKYNNLFVCMDLYLFTGNGKDQSRFPNYLTDDNIWNDYRYLIGYEAWMRFIPVDMVFTILLQAGIELPVKFADSVDIDRLEDWSKDYQYGKELLVKSYTGSKQGTSTPDLDGLHERMMTEVDDYLDSFAFQDDKEYVFFFPPYSALYWYTTLEDRYFDVYMEVKTHIVTKLLEKDNVTVFDFQAIPQICDLDNYKDITHYSAEINEFMVDCFKGGDYTVKTDTIDESVHNLEILVEQFSEENANWLNPL